MSVKKIFISNPINASVKNMHLVFVMVFPSIYMTYHSKEYVYRNATHVAYISLL